MFTTTEPTLLVATQPDYWLLAQPLHWVSAELDIVIPRGFKTDLASIPRVLQNVLDVDGRSRCPAILHDWLYTLQPCSRAFADQMLRKALLAYGESAATACVYWLGVRAGGWQPWRSRGASGPQVRDFGTADDYWKWYRTVGTGLTKVQAA